MADNDNIEGDAHRFDNIDSSDSASNGDDSDFGGDGGSREYNGAGSEFDDDGGSDDDNFGVFDFCEGEDQLHATALLCMHLFLRLSMPPMPWMNDFHPTSIGLIEISN